MERIFTVKEDEAKKYAAYRPRYPDSLFQYIANLCPSRNCALDCATGSGQAAIGLANIFTEVVATDISNQQLNNSIKYKNINYIVSTAESSSFKDESFDLITVAQALHWFDLDKFWLEVDRILVPGGIFAAWGYDWVTINPEIDRIINENILKPIMPFWSKRNKILWDGYKDCLMPYTPLDTPKIMIEKSVHIIELINYMTTWSAYKYYVEKTNDTQLPQNTLKALSGVWKNEKKTIKMPLHILLGKKDNA